MAPSDFVPNPADVKYLVDNEVPQIINDLVSAITTAQPSNVSLFAVDWINQQKSQLNLLDSKKVEITPFEGQKTGTSGLRKKVTVFQQPNYLQAWLQSLFRALCRTEPNFLGSTLVLGGDGRYFNELAAQTVIRMAFANGVKTLIVGQKGLMATPAVSAVIRKEGALGGIIMTASHNPGGPTEDWGIKYNCSNGEPAPEKLTDIIYEETKKIRHYVIKNFPIVDLTRLGTTRLPGGHVVHVISSHGIYLDLLRGIFDFPRVKHFCQKAEMKFVLDCMHGVGGVAATAFIEEMALGPKANTSLRNNIPKPDFGGLHPDPNLKYAAHLVDIMYSAEGPSFGAAFDGDADRNMILGKKFFVTPSDSVAVIASYADKCIPYFRENGIKGLARSMPTATSLDRVALYLGVPLYEVPTGWKFFCNLMDANKVSICGEESFGTGAAHIREKDGLWAVIAWISILQYCNATPQRPFTSVQDIVERHWRQFGRSLYCRYDYEAITGPQGKPNPAEVMMDKLASQARGNVFKGQQFPGPRGSIYTVASSDIFEYHDPVDGSKAGNQGIRIFFTDTSRIIFRLSGTGSAGATVRIYFERYQPPGQVETKLDAKEACKELAAIALKLSDLQDMTGRMSPTVIT